MLQYRTSILVIRYYFVIINGFIGFVLRVVFGTEHIILETGSHRKLFSVTGHTKPLSYMLCLECKAVDRIKKPVDVECHWSLFELISVVCFTHI
jgi:glutaminase